MMSEWTPERIAAAQEVMRLEDVDCLAMYSVSRSASRELTDPERIALIDLARIGLAAVTDRANTAIQAYQDLLAAVVRAGVSDQVTRALAEIMQERDEETPTGD